MVFLSDEWLDGRRLELAARGSVPLGEGRSVRVTFSFANTPEGMVDSFTVTLAPMGAAIAFGVHEDATAHVAMDYEDARGVFEGEGDSAQLLREGRMKVRGDLHALIEVVEWLQEGRR